MSQHYFQTFDLQGVSVLVLAGWDRPLGQFFLVVEDADNKEDDAAPIYSNLEDPNVGAKKMVGLDYFRQKLKELHINVPGEMLEAVEQDRINNAGNRVIDWTGHG